MVTSDQIVGRPRTECAVASILPEPATAPVNWYTSVIVHIQRLKTYRHAVKGAPTGETSWDNIDLTLREISEATVEKQEEALRKKRSLSSRCPSYKNSAPAGRQIKQTKDTDFETPTKPHGILGR